MEMVNEDLLQRKITVPDMIPLLIVVSDCHFFLLLLIEKHQLPRTLVHQSLYLVLALESPTQADFNLPVKHRQILSFNAIHLYFAGLLAPGNSLFTSCNNTAPPRMLPHLNHIVQYYSLYSMIG